MPDGSSLPKSKASPRRWPCSGARELRFGPDYFEPVVLADGRPARLLTLREDHAPELVRGFERLSDRSRYFRFLTPKRWLSDEQVRALVALDGCGQFAIAASVHTLAGWQGAAVGRLAPVPGTPNTTELAITVIDEFQHLGIGRLLLERLLAAAIERGYTRVRGEVLAENRPMLRLLRSALPQLTSQPVGAVVLIDAPLAPPPMRLAS
jgi:GNAT superfamily N-acetyltransferase